MDQCDLFRRQSMSKYGRRLAVETDWIRQLASETWIFDIHHRPGNGIWNLSKDYAAADLSTVLCVGYVSFSEDVASQVSEFDG
jgi:hypothetical protein